MPEIETGREDIRALNGLHIWHYDTSSCSQRVRMTLYEKDLDWTSHHVDLAAGEHLDPQFIALNPATLVPVLVHDGRVYVESNDIIAYLDRTFPQPPLLPDAEGDRERVLELAARSAKVQSALKLLSYEFLFKPKALKTPAQLKRFVAACPSPDLVKFHSEFSQGKGFGKDRITEAVRTFESAFDMLEERLAADPWLSGAHFGLADIAWLVNVYRLSLMRFSLDRYPRLANWLDRCRKRPSSKRAIDAFEGRPKRAFFRVYTLIRALKGTSVNHFR